jgi:hypothetical protein
MYPACILPRRALETEFPDLKRDHLERGKGACRLEVDKVHQGQVVTKLVIAPDALVVVQEIAAAIENKPIAVDLNGFPMMRRMAVNDRNIGSVDKA